MTTAEPRDRTVRRVGRQPAERALPGRPGRTPRAFTLIEVLVVVAIIALLVAILIPALTAARNQAQAAACAARIRQAATGAVIHLVETGSRKERWSTNYGWATHSLRVNKGQTELFTCPADPAPRPIPAVFVRLYTDAAGQNYRGTTSSDAIFNHHFDEGGGNWQTDIQDSVDGQEFGYDSFENDVDLVLGYQVSGKETFAQVRVVERESGWQRFDVYTYKNELLWTSAQVGNGPTTAPILWMSYSANASAGLKNVKGSPALIVEGGKPGILAESFVGAKVVPADDLRRVLRFRHGGAARSVDLAGRDYTQRGAMGQRPDRHYQPRQTMNVGYLDSHVERLPYWRLMTMNPPNMPTPNGTVWFGGRRGGIVSFD